MLVIIALIYNEVQDNRNNTTDKDTGYVSNYQQNHRNDIFMSAKDKAHYLMSNKWKQLKQQRMDIAQHKCEVVGCNHTTNLVLHHETYIRLSNEGINDVKIICKQHHQQIHDLLGYDRLTEYPISII